MDHLAQPGGLGSQFTVSAQDGVVEAHGQFEGGLGGVEACVVDLGSEQAGAVLEVPGLRAAMKRVEQTKEETMREQRGLTLHGAGQRLEDSLQPATEDNHALNARLASLEADLAAARTNGSAARSGDI
ncbi:hypothetical protein [Streptomyces sp. V1I1]|uniref:hypothetical protein n=1 Tax=Streptomyces sp. V1I1 TaxID=3042272 RepID=UPI0027D7FE2D|nr:hypothetical protein [Streptomyces sp. V1I1]